MQNKLRRRPSDHKPQVDFSAHTFRLSTAKTYLSRLTDKARKGEPVYIIRGHDRFMLQYVPEFEPIPIRPPGYFSEYYTKEETEQENRLSQDSILRPPKDLE